MVLKKIKITAGNITINAELNESKTAQLIWEKLPMDSIVNTWGEEIYFNIPIDADLENAVEVVEIGDLGYWPTGNAFCIFFGNTPVSTETEIRPASAVNPIGEFAGDTDLLKTIRNGEKIKIEKI